MAKFLDLEGVKTLWEKIKAQFVSKSELEQRLLEITEKVEGFGSTFSQEFERIYGQINNFQDADQVEDIIADVLPDLIPRTVPYILRFNKADFPSGQDFNAFTQPDTIYNIYGKFPNSPKPDTHIQGQLINISFIDQEDKIVEANGSYVQQFLILIDGEIYNRVRYDNKWNEWKQIQRI